MSVSKIVAAAASGVGGAGLDVDEVFSCFLYDGNSSTQTITNSIDLSGEGGLVWIKARDSGQEHNLYDTERGVYKFLQSQSTAAEDQNVPKGLTAFNSNGFSLDVGNESGSSFNNSSYEYVSWTFRKAPKFFDIVTYTGNGTAGRQIAHNLGTTVGMLVVKRTDQAGDWSVFHRKLNGGTNSGNYRLELQGTVNESTTSHWNDTVPSSTTFTVGNSNTVNGNDKTYVAYLFAHNNNDGEFGPDSDQDIIKCGSYTGTGARLDINLGFEAQWVMIKQTDVSRDWHVFDVMRGMPVNTSGKHLKFNTSDAEASSSYMYANSTGFTLADGHPEVCANGGNYIYMAIRRGPLAAPTDATKVFAIDQQNASEPYLTSGFPVDFAFQKRKDNSSNWMTGSRLQGAKQLNLDLTAAEGNETAHQWDYMDGFRSDAYSSDWFGWMWKRAPGYFDVVAYTGTGSAQTISHNLGVVPEMMWVKARSASGEMWFVYHKDLNVNGDNAPETDYLWLNGSHAAADDADAWNDTAPTASVFSVKSGGGTNGSGVTYIAYLFASAPGVSKVGSYTGNGASSQVIDCGFSSGARFVMIKRTDSSNDWYVWDSTRGIVAGNDARLALNNNSAEQSGDDQIDPNSSGFEVVLSGGLNNNGLGPYIFYAIA